MPGTLVEGDLEACIVPYVSSLLEQHWQTGFISPVAALLRGNPLEDFQGDSLAIRNEQPFADDTATRDSPAGSAEVRAEAAAPSLSAPPRLRASAWLRTVWTHDEHLPLWSEPGLQFDDDSPSTGSGVRLPDLDDSAFRIAVGLNDLTWAECTGGSRTVVIVLSDLLCDSAELWEGIAHAALPVFGLHTPPSVLVQLDDALREHTGVPALALLYLESVLSCVASGGADVVLLASSAATALLAQEVAIQLRLRKSILPRSISQVVALRLTQGEAGGEQQPPGALNSPAYQALFSSLVALCSGEPPSWAAFMSWMAEHDTVDEQLSSLSQLRPFGTSRAQWDADVDCSMRRLVSLMSLAQSRLPWRVVSAHVGSRVSAPTASLPRLRRAHSFARVFRAALLTRPASEPTADADIFVVEPTELSTTADPRALV